MTETEQGLTIPEYLALERLAETKSDYLDGKVLAQRSTSREHNVIVGNASAALHKQLTATSCEIYATAMRVKTPTDFVTYPDVIAVCGVPRFEDDETDTLLNPTLIVEVLSKATENYDRTTKLNHYQTVPSLREIVLLAEDLPQVEHWRRQGDNRWRVEEIQGLGWTIDLPTIHCRLPLETVYRRVFT